jgi:Bacterial export proteins, family 3
MTGPEVMDVARDAIVTLILVTTPLMAVGLIVGVAVSLLQALTQIQEATLVFVPKILGDLRDAFDCAAVHGRHAACELRAHRRAHRWRRVRSFGMCQLRSFIALVPAKAGTQRRTIGLCLVVLDCRLRGNERSRA